MQAQPGELEFCNLFEKAGRVGHAFAKCIGKDPAPFILATQMKVVELADKPQAAYDYITALAMSVAHKKGLGNPQF